MAQSSDNLIRAVWPLPGGNDRYLHTLDQILKWAASTEETNRETFADWFMSRYNVSDTTVNSYLRVVLLLDALESHDDGALSITPFGERILDAEGEAKAHTVIDRFMKGYLGFREVLAVYAQADGSLHLDELFETLQPYFPRWTSAAQFEYRALWLLSLGCLEQDRGRYYEITDLGRSIAEEYPPELDVQQPVQVSEGDREREDEAKPELTANEVVRLIEELKEAATDSGTPERLERAVAEAFQFLGFMVDHLGEPGDTDVLVRANIGPQSYAVVVDAKARGGGKLHDLQVYTLQEHLSKNEAEYAVVIAGDFAGGKVVRHAQDNGIVLLSTAMLTKWLQLHASTPLNLHEYQVMFTTPGLLATLPTALELAAERHQRWGQLLVDMIELIEETYDHGLEQTLPASQIFYMLVTRLRGVRYAQQETRDAIAFLTHPAIGAALSDEAGISLAMNRTTLARTLRALAKQIETIESETQE